MGHPKTTKQLARSAASSPRLRVAKKVAKNYRKKWMQTSEGKKISDLTKGLKKVKGPVRFGAYGKPKK